MIQPTFTVKEEKKEANYGRFVIEPLNQGYGHTLGTALRRVLLSSLKGAAVTKVKIDGVRHQFSTIPGVKEDIVELILNIKKLKLKYDKDEPIHMKLSVKGKGTITAAQIETPAEVAVVDKDVYLATLTSGQARLNIDFVVESAYGYSPFEERKKEELGLIPIDANFTPVTRVNYKVESTRVGGVTDLDKLILEVWTNGTIRPDEALKHAAKIISSYFTHLYAPDNEERKKEEKKESIPKELARLTLEELELPTRVVNALSNGNIETVADLLKTPYDTLLKNKNVGVKSLSIVEAKLNKKGLSLIKEKQGENKKK